MHKLLISNDAACTLREHHFVERAWTSWRGIQASFLEKRLEQLDRMACSL
jgi:hypothetical protein